MECTGCGYEFRYVDKRYATSTIEKDRIIVQYRCPSCYASYKRELRSKFKNRVVRE